MWLCEFDEGFFKEQSKNGMFLLSRFIFNIAYSSLFYENSWIFGFCGIA
jgi:hypothetical protein